MYSKFSSNNLGILLLSVCTQSLFAANQGLVWDPTPSNSSEVRWDPYTVRNAKFGTAAQTLRAYISLKPPAKTCILLQRTPDEPDLRICKTQAIAVRPQDLDAKGMITWRYWIGDNPNYQTVSWATPYRLSGWLTLQETTTYNVHQIVQLSCISSPGPKGSTRISLQFAPDLEWRIDIPKDLNLLPQPDPKPNLYIMSDTSHQGGGVQANGDSAASGDKDKEKDKPKDWVSWKIAARDSYLLPVEAVTIDDRNPNRIKGQCRINFGSAPHSQPQFECQNTHDLRYFSAAIPCLKPRT